MDSREKILSAVKKNQPASVGLPDLNLITPASPDFAERFKTLLVSIGGAAIEVEGFDQLTNFIKTNFPDKRIVSTIKELTEKIGINDFSQGPHLLENVGLAVLQGHFGVAENGAVWITDEQMGDRALPYISEHLALVIDKQSIVATMHDAYEKIGAAAYNLGAFIAGPSKTADIEQSLVLGAHGAKSLIVFLMGEKFF
jgi:L-lactate dehydrogenase complex protein LldG